MRAGSPVGYGHSWAAPADTNLGLLPVGYADGLPRAASGQAEIMVRGRRYPVAGLISMDQTVIDLRSQQVHPGEIATVFGPGTSGEPTVADWAAWAGTIEHEIVTGIGARVHRQVTGDVPAGVPGEGAGRRHRRGATIASTKSPSHPPRRSPPRWRRPATRSSG